MIARAEKISDDPVLELITSFFSNLFENAVAHGVSNQIKVNTLDRTFVTLMEFANLQNAYYSERPRIILNQ